MVATACDLPPEILCAALECLSRDYKALFSAALVCRKWAEAAIDTMWHKPYPEALMRLPPHRRQHYADRIQSLLFMKADELEKQKSLGDLTFPLLQNLQLYEYDGNRNTIEPYLHVSLKSLDIQVGLVSEHLLGLLEVQCPHLRHLRLVNVASDRLLRLRESCKGLTSLNTQMGTEDADTTLFRAMAAQKSLERWEISGRIEYDLVHNVVACIHFPFHRLKELDVEMMSSKAAMLLLEKAKALQRFDTRLEDTEYRLRQLLAGIEIPDRLRDLKLRFPNEVALDQEDLTQLARFGNMQSISLRSHCSDVFSPVLSVTECTCLFSSLPNLRSLDLELSCGLHVSHLPILGRKCRLLRTFYLLGDFNVKELQDCFSNANDDEVLFPDLHVFIMLDAIEREFANCAEPVKTRKGGMRIMEMREAESIADMIIKHAPELECLDLLQETRLSSQITDKWKEKTGRPLCDYIGV